MTTIATKNGFKVDVVGEHREGKCEDCNTLTVKEFYMDGERKRVRMICPMCGGQGRLIVRTTSIQPPRPPTCSKAGCLWRFFFRVVYTSLLSTYHKKRIEYATTKRHYGIPAKYRTGDPSPQNTKEAIKALIGLKLEKIRR